MMIWYGAGAVTAIAIAWLAALVHASGHAPIGLVSVVVGIAIGASLWKIAGVLRTPDSRRHLIVGTILLAMVAIAAEHTWLYLDFRRQWTEARERSPQVAIFRSETPWSFREFITSEATPQQITVWCVDAAFILTSAAATMFVLTMPRPSPTPET